MLDYMLLSPKSQETQGEASQAGRHSAASAPPPRGDTSLTEPLSVSEVELLSLICSARVVLCRVCVSLSNRQKGATTLSDVIV
jgi:hypothetical protein